MVVLANGANRRSEFPRHVKVAVVKRATRDGVVYCEHCGLPAKKWQIDHVIPDGLGGKPVIENAELICEVCYGLKNPADTTAIAKAKRREAAALGIKIRKRPIRSGGFPKDAAREARRAERRQELAALPRRPIYAPVDGGVQS